MRSKEERRADHERREAERKAKYAASMERNRARGEAVGEVVRERLARRPDETITTLPEPVSENTLKQWTRAGRLTGQPPLAQIKWETQYLLAFTRQQQRINAGETIPEDELIAPLKRQTHWGDAADSIITNGWI